MNHIFDTLDIATLARVKRISDRPYPEWSEEDREFMRTMVPPQVNECGDCSHCCVAPAISVLDAVAPLTAVKPACQACEYCDTSSGGCRVYNARPSVCKDYFCLYALGTVPYRPKDCGVAWTPQSFEESPGDFVVAGHCLDTGEVLRRQENLEMIVRFLTEMRPAPVAVVLRDDKLGYQFALTPHGVGAVVADIDQNDPLKCNANPASARVAPFRLVVEKLD